MLSYLIVIIRPKKLAIDYTQSKTKQKNLKKPKLSLVNAGPRNRVSILSTKCGGCQPKGLIVACS